MSERIRLAALAHTAFGQDCGWPPHEFTALVPALQSGWLAVADALLADRQAHVAQAEARAERAESLLTAADQEIAERLIASEGREKALRAFVEDIAGGDCDQYDRHLSPVPCGQCQSCRARALIAPPRDAGAT